MNMGECPHKGCNEQLWEPLPEKTPAFSNFNCNGCGQGIWYKHSRIDSVAYTEEYFLETHIIDHEAKTITAKKGD